MSQWLLGLAVMASVALIGVGAWGLLQPRTPKLKPGLMIAAGVVTLINVWLAAAPL